MATAVFMINLGYVFEGSFYKLRDFGFVSETLKGEEYDHFRYSMMGPGNRFRDSWLGELSVPLPANYVIGLDLQKWELEQKMPSYLRGQWQLGGWWYYYLYALAIKVPLGTCVLILLTVFLRLCGIVAASRWRDEVAILLPVGVILAFVSSQTGFNHHLRYVLPVFPFIFIWLSQLGCLFATTNCKSQVLVAAAMLWFVASSLSVYPHSLSYFNELAGGPTGGHAHLLSSNIDWGQDLLYLKRWLDHHPEARPLGLAYSGHTNPRIAGIDFVRAPAGPAETESSLVVYSEPEGPRPGWFAISVAFLREQTGTFAYFLKFRPVAMAGYSIYIYHISEEEANRARKELGLDPLH